MSRALQDRDYLPTTFEDRGVAVPFTTPSLISARVRKAEREAVEYILANPAGGAGYYIMGWHAVEGLCRVTMHDRLLSGALTTLSAITPRAVRRAARSVAASGAAGRPASRAAADADQLDSDQVLLVNFTLLKRVAAAAGLVEIDWTRINAADGLQRGLIRNALSRLEPMVGADVDTILQRIQDLAQVISPVGLGRSDKGSHCQTVLAALTKLDPSLKAFASADGGDAVYGAQIIAREARATFEAGNRLVAACYAELENPLALISGWGSQSARIAELFARPEWLLDGWQGICALWDSTPAERGQQREAICEMERMLPIVPKVLGEWTASPVNSLGGTHQRRWIKANIDWRSGVHVLDRIARNEWLRACTA